MALSSVSLAPTAHASFTVMLVLRRVKRMPYGLYTWFSVLYCAVAMPGEALLALDAFVTMCMYRSTLMGVSRAASVALWLMAPCKSCDLCSP